MKQVIFFSLIFIAESVFGIRISEKECHDNWNGQSLKIAKAFNDTNEDAAPREFPFTAKIENSTSYHNGILISKNFVLSVAFVFTNSTKLFVVLGELDVGTNTDDARPRSYAVIETFTHPNFNPNDRNSNLQLFKLNESVTFDKYVRPACLSSHTFSMDLRLLEIGWGTTNVRSNKRLHKIKLNHISNESCKQNRLSVQTRYIEDIDNGTIFCAGPKKDDRMLCGGYAGSAVINPFGEIVGIASASFGCDHHHQNLHVFVRVAAYIDWIEGIVWKDEENEFESTTKRKWEISTQSSSPTVPENEERLSSSTTEPTRLYKKTSIDWKYAIIIVLFLIVSGLLCAAVIYIRKLRSRYYERPVAFAFSTKSES